MSGGQFEYQQYRLTDIADEMKELLKYNGKPDEDDYVRNLHPNEVILMEQLIPELETMYDKIHDLDWSLSGDTSPEDEALTRWIENK